jgi:hypothetical protein
LQILIRNISKKNKFNKFDYRTGTFGFCIGVGKSMATLRSSAAILLVVAPGSESAAMRASADPWPAWTGLPGGRKTGRHKSSIVFLPPYFSTYNKKI